MEWMNFPRAKNAFSWREFHFYVWIHYNQWNKNSQFENIFVYWKHYISFINFCCILIIVQFPSYAYLMKCVQFWGDLFVFNCTSECKILITVFELMNQRIPRKYASGVLDKNKYVKLWIERSPKSTCLISNH